MHFNIFQEATTTEDSGPFIVEYLECNNQFTEGNV